MTKQTIVITGATGFVGRQLLPLIIKKFGKSQILALVQILDTEYEKSGMAIVKKSGVTYQECNLATGVGLENLPKNPKVVFHLAAATDTSFPDHSANDVGTKNLLRALGKLDSKTHIIYTSTIALAVGRNDCSKPLTEQSPYAATNEYSRTKMRAEKYILRKCIQDKFKLTVIRLNTTYGGSYRPNSFFDVINKKIDSNSLITRLNWPGLTSIIHVKDVAIALLLITEKNPKSGQPQIFIAYAESLTFWQICKMVYEAKGMEYYPVKLPSYVWKLIQMGRVMIPGFEKIFPPAFYNLIWRAGLISDNASWCQTDKLFNYLPNWKPRKLISTINEVVN